MFNKNNHAAFNRVWVQVGEAYVKRSHVIAVEALEFVEKNKTKIHLSSGAAIVTNEHRADVLKRIFGWEYVVGRGYCRPHDWSNEK